MRKGTIVAASGIALLALAAGMIVSARVNAPAKGRVAFTVKSRLTTAGQTYGHVKYVSASGATRTVTTNAEGRTRESVYVPGLGAFEKGTQGWKRNPNVSGERGAEASAAELAVKLEAGDQFNRKDTVLGFEAIVSRVETEGQAAEFYTIPQLGPYPVRVVEYDARGNEVSRLEPVEIKIGEPSPEDVRGDFR